MSKQQSETMEQKILTLLKGERKKEFSRKQISHLLNIKKKNYHAFEAALNDLVKEGLIRRTKGHTYIYQGVSRYVGELSLTRAGFGFVSVEGLDDDIFVARHNMNTALDRDTVEVQLYAQNRRGKRKEGHIIRVIKRFRSVIVGTYRETDYYRYVVPDSTKIYRDIIVAADKTLGAKDGQKVLVSFDRWDSDQHNPEGAIVDILGDPDTPGLDIISVAYAHNLPVKFPAEVEQAAQKKNARITKEILNDRIDLRDLVCFTVDPVDAKDFDDAVSLEKLDNGHWRLGVHIADVSHFVEEGSVLDKEALNRGTSVYLVDRVIPMLPEKLSNDLCSLKPNVDRLAFSCFMELNDTLEVVNHAIHPSVIHSKRRFSYEEVQEIVDSQKPDPLLPVLQDMMALSRKLTRQRFEKGSIDFETPEVRFILDDKGKPKEIIPKKRLGAHRMIEEFMLMANKTVAAHIKTLPGYKSPPPFIYRVHEKPSPEKMEKFYNLLKALNIPFKPVKRISSRWFQQIIESIKGTPEETVIEEVALRSMMKAVYSEKNIGHFGLAFDDYTHFTSPIRRYPDLEVHRLLRLYAAEKPKELKKLRGHLAEICKQSSRQERLAVEAERDSIKLKQVEYIERHIGEAFHGVVSGVTASGIYVELNDTYIEGFVPMTSMTDDYYIYDEATYSMTGRHSGRPIRLGDTVEIRVESVELSRRDINFSLLESADFEPRPLPPKPEATGKRNRKRSSRKKGNRKQK